MSMPETPAGRSRGRILLLAIGTLLWVAVFAAAYVFIVQPKMNVAGPSAMPQSTEGIPPGAESEATDAGAEMTWDPTGVAEFSFKNLEGETVTKADLLGRPTAFAFVFTRCGYTCPMITAAMRKLQQDLEGKDVQFVSITVDPEFDDAERLRKYAELHGCDLSNWEFLMGDQIETYRLIEGSFKVPVKEMEGPDRKPGFEVLHSNNIMHVNAEGVVVGKYNGILPEEVAQARKALAAEADALAAAPDMTPVEAPLPAAEDA